MSDYFFLEIINRIGLKHQGDMSMIFSPWRPDSHRS